MTSVLLSLTAALGVFWLYTALSWGWEGFGFGPRVTQRARRSGRSFDAWLTQAGLGGVDKREFLAVVAMLFVLGSVLAFATFGGIASALAIGSSRRRSPSPAIGFAARTVANAPKRRGPE